MNDKMKRERERERKRERRYFACFVVNYNLGSLNHASPLLGAAF